MPTPQVERLHLADVFPPDGHPQAGETCPVFAFLVRHPDGVALVDTGIGEEHPLIDRLYRPKRYALPEALAAHDVALDDVTHVVNTHLHFDHCGGNKLFPNARSFAQAAEHKAAEERLYTVPEWIDGTSFELLGGDAEILAGVTIVPTPGHTAGHQSVVVAGDDGIAIIAGHAGYTAREFAGDAGAGTIGAFGAWDENEYRRSLEKLRAMSPRRVYFNHDAETWRAIGEETI